PAAVRSIQISPLEVSPSQPREIEATCTGTRSSASSVCASTPAARHWPMACATADCKACSLRSVTPTPLPSPAGSCGMAAWPSTMVMTTWLDVIGAMPSACTVAVLGRSSRQVLKLPMTKSDSVAVGDCDERVSARKLEKQVPRPRAVRLTPSSRNSPGAGPELWLLSVNDQGTVMGAPLTTAKVLPPIGLPLFRATRPPVAASRTHLKTLMVEVEPPMV